MILRYTWYKAGWKKLFFPYTSEIINEMTEQEGERVSQKILISVIGYQWVC